jgi:hypothetical protein
MPKAIAASSHKRRHNPLEDDILATGILKNREGRPSKRANKKVAEEENYVDSKASRKILAMSRELMDEEEQQLKNKQVTVASTAFDFDPSRMDHDEDDQEEFVNNEEWGDEDEDAGDNDNEVDAADLEIFNRFVQPTMKDDPLLTHGWDQKPADGEEEKEEQTNLADLILQKIAEKEAMTGGQNGGNPIEEDYEIPPKVVEVFTKYVLGGPVDTLAKGLHIDSVPGLGLFLLGTSLAHYQNPLRSCQQFLTGKISSN